MLIFIVASLGYIVILFRQSLPIQSSTIIKREKLFDRVLPRTPDPAFNLTMKKGKRFIILVTSYRSGSTFLGKLFDENPAVQYIFEPLHNGPLRQFYEGGKLAGAAERYSERELAMLYLQQIMHNCTAFASSFYFERWKWCGNTAENLLIHGTSDCPSYHEPSVIATICNHRPTSVLKVIRLRQLSDLLLIRHIKDADVQIVHSTRHPVGVMSSRVQGNTWFTWNQRTIIEGGMGEIPPARDRLTRIAWEVYNYCHEAGEVRRLLAREPWLRGRYIRVTHQQLSLDPVRTAQRIYKHVGLDLTADLLEFIRNTTSGQVAEEQSLNNDQDQLITSRVSRDILFKWRDLDRLRPDHMRAIEAVCSELLTDTREEVSFDTFRPEHLLKVFE